MAALQTQGLKPDDVLRIGQRVVVRRNDNLSEDVTDLGQSFEVISDRSIPNFYFYDWQRTEKIIGDEIDTMLKARKTPEKAWEDAEARLVAELSR